MENNKINIAEILKKCPHGMELDSPAYNNLYFDNIIDSDSYPIKCYTTYNGMLNTVFFTKYGEIRREENAKCVIFPKGKTTWEGFVPPCKFKDGDILYIDCNNNEDTHKEYQYIFILKEISDSKIYCYCYMDEANKYKKFDISWLSDKIYPLRLATEEEKQKLFDAIKDNGYKWNAETKTLEKLIKPKFKIGDRIKLKKHPDIISTVTKINEDGSISINDYEWVIKHEFQDRFELVPNKFDISTLVPFESRVLVRDYNTNIWKPAIFGDYIDDYRERYKYVVVGGHFYEQLIPYEGNEHLRGKTDDCDDYYKSWED